MQRVCLSRFLCSAPQAALLTFCSAAALPHLCMAQQPKAPPVVQAMLEKPFVSRAQDMSFADVTALLCKSAHLNIAADGEPMLKRAGFDFKGTLREALDAVAAKFDMQWTVTKGGTVLMSKRFTDAADFPQLSLIETRQIVKDEIKALRTVNYDIEPRAWVEQIQTLYKSLMPEQVETLRSTGRLAVTQFAADQSELLTKIIYGFSFATSLDYWKQLEEKLPLLPNSYLKTVLTGGDPTDPKVPRYYSVRHVQPAKNNSLRFDPLLTVPVDAAKEQP